MGSASDRDISLFKNYGRIVNRLSRFGFVPFSWDKNKLGIVTKAPSPFNAIARIFSVLSLMILLNFQLLRVLLNGQISVLSKLHLVGRTLNVTTIFFSYQIIFQNPHYLPNIVNNLVKVYFKLKGKFHWFF